MVRLRKRRVFRRRDQRGMSLVELLVTMVVGGIALTMGTMLFTTMTDHALSTQRQVDAQMKARQSLTDVLRYLRNAAPLGSCAQWDSTFDQNPINGDLANSAAPQHCLRINGNATEPAVIGTLPSLQFYSYAEGKTSGQAPDILTFKIDPAAKTLTVTKRVALAATMFEAYCSRKPSTLRCPSSPQGWSSEVTIAVIPVSGGAFTYYDGSAQVTSDPAGVRMVAIQLDATYKDAHQQSQTFVYRATVSLRGAQYLGSS